tara:strand:+ start:3154 stop:3780 length:627 start_codon:yes stop_codon:yes gene_type:complete
MAGSLIQSVTNKARADKFLLVVTLPPVLKDINTSILSPRNQDQIQEDALQFSIWGVVVPSVSIPNQALRFAGQGYNVTGQSRSEYPPISVNFTIDNNFNNYWMLWKWLDTMNKIKESGMDSHFADKNIDKNPTLLENKYTDYQTTMTVYALDEYNNKVAKFDYSNSFITELGEIRYNYRTETELESSFTFVFNQMDITLLEGGSPAGE